MYPKIHLLPTYQTVLFQLGIRPNKHFTFVDKLCVANLFGMVYMTLAFLLFSARTVGDFTEALYSTSIYGLFCIFFFVLIRRKFTLYNIFADIEQLIETRKFI